MWKRAVICSFVCVVVLRIHGCGGEQETGSARLGFAILKCRGTIGRGRLKDSWYAIARTQAQRALVSDEGDTRFQRQVIEEFHHGIYHGLESAYPSVFGSSSENSELAIAIRDSFGNCELSGICAPAENCEHYQCECSNHDGSCNDAGQYNCRFNRGSCDGAFHYSAPSCGPGSCLMTEGFYHAWTAAYGYNCGGRDLSNEWELCDRDEFMANSHVEKLRKLVMGLSESQAVHGYNLPSRLPDGVYNVRGEESASSTTTTKTATTSASSTSTTEFVSEVVVQRATLAMTLPDDATEESLLADTSFTDALAAGIAAVLGNGFSGDDVTITEVRFFSSLRRKLQQYSPSRRSLAAQSIEVSYELRVTSEEQKLAVADFVSSQDTATSLVNELTSVLPDDFAVTSVSSIETSVASEENTITTTSTSTTSTDSVSVSGPASISMVAMVLIISSPN